MRIFDPLKAALLALAYWLYSRTWRLEYVRKPRLAAGPTVYAHWHGDELLLVGAFAGSRMAVMASRSRDGELMKRVLTWLGYRVSRGSSSRGGAAGLKGLIDAVAKGRNEASLAVDGPRGPIYKVKPGIVKLAQETGTAILPGAASAGRRFVFKKAWNRCYLPLPFAKCVIVYGDPVRVPRDADAEMVERLRLDLERQLVRLKAEAESYFPRKANELIPTGV